MVDKITKAPKQNELINTVNEIIDQLGTGTGNISLESGDNITIENVLAYGNPVLVGTSYWQAITYGNNKFVAVGNGGRATTSTDGITWTEPVQIGTTSYWNTITYGNNKFVAVVDGGRATTSTDGVTWTEPVQIGTTSSWNAITYGNGKFVAGGNDGYITTSINGVNWTTPVRVQIGSGGWNAITYGNGKFVAGGGWGYTTTSTDGVNWTTPVRVGSSGWFAITYGNNKFVAVGDGARTTTSTDGVTWTEPVRVGTSSCNAITYGNNMFVAVGNEGYTITSTDGVTWTEPVRVGTRIWSGIAYGNGKFVAVGDNGYVFSIYISSYIISATIPNKYVTETELSTELEDYTPTDNLGAVALSNSYNDLDNKPTIPDAQIQSDWTQTTTTAKDYIKNKPSLATVATSGSYNDLTNKPTIPPAVTVDSALSSTSTNPVQNKVINSALSDKYDASNPDGYITEITSTDISNALGYTPPNYFTGSNILINPVEKVTLPSGYTQVSYIEGTGSQYIDTGWNFSNTYPVKIDCKFIVNSYSGGSGGYPTVYGLQTSAYTNWIYPFYINAGNFNPHIGGSANIDSVPCALGQLYDTSFTIGSGTWSRTINGTDTSDIWTGTITTGANMFLFGGSYGANPINQLIGKIFSFKITVNNSVVRNYIPCKRNSDNVAGMYDLVTSTFKPSASGSFLMGEEVTASGDMISAIVPTNNNQLVNGAGYITNSAIANMQTTTNLVTSLSASSTDSQYPSAKCVYDIVGDIETALNTINSGV